MILKSCGAVFTKKKCKNAHAQKKSTCKHERPSNLWTLWGGGVLWINLYEKMQKRSTVTQFTRRATTQIKENSQRTNNSDNHITNIYKKTTKGAPNMTLKLTNDNHSNNSNNNDNHSKNSNNNDNHSKNSNHSDNHITKI